MSRSRSRSRKSASRRRKRKSRILRVPGWYYALLVVIALVGAILIVTSMRISTANLANANDVPKGDPAAPVTIIEWGSFQ